MIKMKLILLLLIQVLFVNSQFTDAQKAAMKQDYFGKHLKSNNCKLNCIDEGFPFCANADYSGGYCCMPGNDCPRYPTTTLNGRTVKLPSLHCSDFWPAGTPNGMRYFVCPNESECGTRDLYP